MKKTSKIVAIIMVLMLAIITLTGCEEKREITAGQLEGYTEYTHSSGAKFQYPSEWRSNGLSSAVGFVNSSNGTNVNILTESVGSGIGLKKYVKASIESIKKQYSSNLLSEINEEYVKLNGKDGCIIDYKVKQSNINMNVKQAIILDNGQAYILTTVLRESSADTDTEIVNNIINSFKK